MVARPGGEVHTLWADGAGNMITRRSFDGGQTWSAGVRVNDVPGTTGGVSSLAMSSKGSLFAAWLDIRNSGPNTLVFDIFTARSNDGGSTWSRAVQINDDQSLRLHDQPSLAVDGNDVVHAAWVDYRTGNYNIFYSNSKDGRHWSANERVTDAETNPATVPKGVRLGDYLGLAADRLGNAFAAWTDGRNGHTDIYFARRAAN